ncbi:DUF309 domain-containing protein [Xylanibacillus composti]|uniref:DUF309 domain-containing protein n=1 Tax=Xylanibacillus composti TaxID=1572762 RepID=A0A8J4H1F2_9BACL|nr:DUF309 domain-containing protein [Xylanibacillus composti]MDT9725569.1 DUF309 domain-containing protein [Xylanibacillus composti]GIQ67662.1 hypothetical protein XYCOK13_04860 [Xylanibacillus composti]
MNYPKAYVDYLVYFHAARDYFECHEVMEEYWKEHPDDPLKEVWHVCIQLAVTAYHERRGNFAGALKMLKQARSRMRATGMPLLLNKAGLDAERLNSMTEHWQCKLETASSEGLQEQNESRFADPVLPIVDQSLLQASRAEAERRGLMWLAPSRMDEASLIHKHKLRDRSDVMKARQEAWLRKRTSD